MLLAVLFHVCQRFYFNHLIRAVDTLGNIGYVNIYRLVYLYVH